MTPAAAQGQGSLDDAQLFWREPEAAVTCLEGAHTEPARRVFKSTLHSDHTKEERGRE